MPPAVHWYSARDLGVIIDSLVSDIAIFALKRDVILQLTN